LNKRVINIFVGYQIISQFHSAEEIKDVMCNYVSPLVKTKLGISIAFKFGDKFETGQYLFTQVENAIHKSEIAIFDISENNQNVLIEIGMAYGEKKFTILLKNNASKKDFEIPSDITAFIYLQYNKMEQIVEDIFLAIENYINNHTHSHFYFKEIWDFDYNDIVYIVCPELQKPEERQNPELNEFLYLAKYGDIDSFLVLFSSISKLHPNVNLKFCTGREFNLIPGNPHSENLILIGGPDYNEITRYYSEKKSITPYEFVEKNEDCEELGIKCPKSGITYFSLFDKESDLKCIEDYGYFIKTKNPGNHNKKIFMINGIHTYGVYGASKCFSLHEHNENEIAKNNCKAIIHTLGNNSCFAALFKVSCVSNKIEIPTINELDILALS
jgi:hypothetical protein